jgi:hypothetical protein
MGGGQGRKLRKEEKKIAQFFAEKSSDTSAL